MAATLSDTPAVQMPWLEGVIEELFERYLEELRNGEDPGDVAPYELVKWTGYQEMELGGCRLELEGRDANTGRSRVFWVVVDFREGLVYLSGKYGLIGESRMLHTMPLRR